VHRSESAPETTGLLAAARSLRTAPPWVALAAVVAVSVAVRSWAALSVPVPWIAPDEMIYGLVGQSLYRSGSLDILGGPTPYYSVVVPGFAGIPLSLGNLELGYDVLKVLQALAMSLTAVPVYLWARSLVDRRLALAAAALTVALPGLVYSGLVMSEVLFYPALLLAAWATARAIERPSAGRQAVLVAAVVLAALTRLQALVLVPAVLTALGVDAALARSAHNLRRFAPTIGAGVLTAVGWGAWTLAGGTAALGGYGVVAHASYDAAEAARFVLYHAASATLLAGVFPVCALLLLLVHAARRGEPDPRRRAYLAVAASFLVWIVVEVGVFASRYVGQLAERDLIGLAPILFVGFVLWLHAGAPRGYWTMSAVGLAVAAPLAALPLGRLVTPYAPPDAPTLAALNDLRHVTSLGVLEVVFFTSAGVAILAFALVPRRLLAVLPIVLAAALVGGSVAASTYASGQSKNLQRDYLGPDPRWVDHTARGPVAFLFDPRSSWVRVWETLFWNRSVKAVYALGGTKAFGPVPQRSVIALTDGRIVPTGPRPLGPEPAYVVAPLGEVESVPAYSFAGRMVAFLGQPGTPSGGVALWRVDRPLRLTSRATGLSPNGDIAPGGDAQIVAYGCPAGAFRLTLLVKGPQAVTILRNGAFYRRLTFASTETWHGSVPTELPPGGARGRNACTLDVQPTGLLGTTVFQVQ
jgi:hypothetical protein